MKNGIYIFLFLILLIYLFIIQLCSQKLTNTLLFCPYKANKNEYYDLCKKYKNNFIPQKIKTYDDINLYGGLLNMNKIPDWNDTIILFSHGNGGWIGNFLNNDCTNMLSNFGSIFLYDYRGYGISEGDSNEDGLYTDIYSVWKYLINEKNIDPKKIIVYGYSLGCAISSHLVSNLNDDELPKMLILESPFSNLKNIADDVFKYISKLTYYDFDNIKHLEKINNKIPVHILYSKSDEVIPFYHTQLLKEKTNCNIIEISGLHAQPIYTIDVLRLFQ
jgi:alpha/beta superfamily hydrolase